jgi:hypothetical protein
LGGSRPSDSKSWSATRCSSARASTRRPRSHDNVASIARRTVRPGCSSIALRSLPPPRQPGRARIGPRTTTPDNAGPTGRYEVDGSGAPEPTAMIATLPAVPRPSRISRATVATSPILTSQPVEPPSTMSPESPAAVDEYSFRVATDGGDSLQVSTRWSTSPVGRCAFRCRGPP